jgi:LmbE family N-acetylglucosaminyl deacetylase
VPDPVALDRYDSLYVSPHLDDVALSCVAKILSERARGLKILVLSLFGSRSHVSSGSARPGAAQALARLEVGLSSLGLPDAPSRSPYYASFRSLAYGSSPEDEVWVSQAARHLTDLAIRTRARHIYAPLGVGGHIDHRLGHEAALRAFHSEPGRNVFFYEERPEAFVPGAVHIRLGQLGARLPPAASHVAHRAGLLRFLLRFHTAPAWRGDLHGIFERLRSAGPAAREWRMSRAWHPQRAFGPRLQPMLHPGDAAAQAGFRQVLAELAPGSSRAALVAQASAYARTLGESEYAERYWLLLPSREGEAVPSALPDAALA